LSKINFMIATLENMAKPKENNKIARGKMKY
jgi:hypothetical protein